MGKEKIEKTVDGNIGVEREKSCFIITPVGTPLSSTRRFADGVIISCIKPVLEDMGFRVTVPHELATPGSITKDVISKIINDELVVANLTGLNPNVMYELGIRHSARKPIVHICEEGTDLPFDIGTDRTLFYRNDMFGVEEMKPKLKKFINEALRIKKPNNPVYDAIGRDAILLDIANRKEGESKDELSILKYIMREIESVRRDNIDKKSLGKESCFEGENDEKKHINYIVLKIPYDVEAMDFFNKVKGFFERNKIRTDMIDLMNNDLKIYFYDGYSEDEIDIAIDKFWAEYYSEK